MWRDELTIELAKELVATQEVTGLSRRRVALLHYVLPTTLEAWLIRGSSEQAEEPYRSFAAAYQQRESVCVKDALEAMERGRYRDWKSAHAYLVERFPDEFGAKAVPVLDPLIEGAKRGKKLDQVRAYVRGQARRDPEFVRVLLEEGMLDVLLEARARALASSAPSESTPEPGAPDDRPIDGSA